MTAWNIRAGVAATTLVFCVLMTLSTTSVAAAFFFGAGAGAGGMRLLYLLDPTVNR